MSSSGSTKTPNLTAITSIPGLRGVLASLLDVRSFNNFVATSTRNHKEFKSFFQTERFIKEKIFATLTAVCSDQIGKTIIVYNRNIPHSHVLIFGDSITSVKGSDNSLFGRFRNLEVLQGIPIADVAVGFKHGFFLTSDGAVYAMGENTGNLGLSTKTESIADPTLIKGLPRVKQVVARSSVGNFIVTENNELYELKHYRCIKVGKNVAKLFDNSGSLFMLDNYGNLHARGDNRAGQLGLPENLYNEFELIEQFEPNSISQIACATSSTLILTTEGLLYGCGVGLTMMRVLNQSDDFVLMNTDGIGKIHRIVAGEGYFIIFNDQGQAFGAGTKERIGLEAKQSGEFIDKITPLPHLDRHGGKYRFVSADKRLLVLSASQIKSEVKHSQQTSTTTTSSATNDSKDTKDNKDAKDSKAKQGNEQETKEAKKESKTEPAQILVKMKLCVVGVQEIQIPEIMLDPNYRADKVAASSPASGFSSRCTIQ